MYSDKYLGKIVVARTAQGLFQFVGKCVSYCDAPSVGVNLPDGSQAHWRADMVQVIEMPEQAIDLLMGRKDG